jgi:hypothetical protein
MVEARAADLMAATLTAIRSGLKANLDPLTAVEGMQISAYLLSSPTPPAIQIYPAETEYDLAMGRGLDRWTLTVQAFFALTSDVGSQVSLDALLAPAGPLSVKQAVESDSTLGGLVDDLSVVSCTGYRVYVRDSGGPVLGAEWEVQVLASGQ